MKTLIYPSQFFNVEDTLNCGQIFRFTPYKKGYLVLSLNKCAYVYNEGNNAYITVNECDEEYFINFFDLDRDYSKIYNFALSRKEEIIVTSAKVGRGIRILNQNLEETLFSFMISQNNNIPRIKKSIEYLCVHLGDKLIFDDFIYYGFPTAEKLSKMPIEFFKKAGLGYRAEYIKELADNISNGLDLNSYKLLDIEIVKEKLLKIKGVGEKVCDCVLLFGLHYTKSFPVDTWIEKVYVQDFKGQLKDRKKISAYFSSEFGENAGYFQQYLFYFKRSKEKLGLNY